MPHLTDNDPVPDALGTLAVVRIEADTELVFEFPLPNLVTEPLSYQKDWERVYIQTKTVTYPTHLLLSSNQTD